MDRVNPQSRSFIMSRVRSAGNASTEMKAVPHFRRHREEFRGWRRGAKVFGRPDFVWLPEKIALFLDGCFWHGCPRCRRTPKSNGSYWKNKINRNRRRDRQVTNTLTG